MLLKVLTIWGEFNQKYITLTSEVNIAVPSDTKVHKSS